MKQGTAKLAEDYCFIHEALRPVGKARRQIAAVPPSNSRPERLWVYWEKDAEDGVAWKEETGKVKKEIYGRVERGYG